MFVSKTPTSPLSQLSTQSPNLLRLPFFSYNPHLQHHISIPLFHIRIRNQAKNTSPSSILHPPSSILPPPKHPRPTKILQGSPIRQFLQPLSSQTRTSVSLLLNPHPTPPPLLKISTNFQLPNSFHKPLSRLTSRKEARRLLPTRPGKFLPFHLHLPRFRASQASRAWCLPGLEEPSILPFMIHPFIQLDINYPERKDSRGSRPRRDRS